MYRFEKLEFTVTVYLFKSTQCAYLYVVVVQKTNSTRTSIHRENRKWKPPDENVER